MAADLEPAEEEAAAVPAPKAKRQRITKKGIAQVVKKDSYEYALILLRTRHQGEHC